MSLANDLPVVSGRQRYLDASRDSWRVVCPEEEHTTIKLSGEVGFYCPTCNLRYDYALDLSENVLLKGT